MKKVGMLAVLAAGLAASCGPSASERQTQREAEQIVAAQQAAADLQRDPGSAQFRRSMFRIHQGDGKLTPIVCGEMNGKNGYGAYVGFRPFLAFYADDRWQADFARDGHTIESAMRCLAATKEPEARSRNQRLDEFGCLDNFDLDYWVYAKALCKLDKPSQGEGLPLALSATDEN